jgi:hypothetical protein
MEGLARQRSTRDGVCFEQVKTATQKLLAYCQEKDWAGHDPYDALNSRIFTAARFLNFRIPRLVLTQALKRSPINIRRLLLVPAKQNPKAMGLFLAALLNLEKICSFVDDDLVDSIVERLIALRSPGISYWCWGYSFPWQTRRLVVPRWAPNAVCTSFVASALLDAYEQRQDSRCLSMAVGAAEYILNELYWTGTGSAAGVGYPLPSLRTQIPNASFLAAAALGRVYRHTGETKFIAAALRLARFSAAQQQADGSWHYGDAPSQAWVDNFHTGYNLCALQSLGRSAGTREFESCIRRGFDFYRSHFFLKEGSVRYFHNRTYPIDIHSVAQSILTPLALRDLDPANVHLAVSVFRWAMEHMWDNRGFFYYRVLRLYTNRISYMRWSQAWMLQALSVLLRELHAAAGQTETRESADFVRT